MPRALRSLVSAGVVAIFVCEVLLIASSYLAAFALNGQFSTEYLIDRSGWISLAAVESVILLAMYFRRLYGDVGPSRLRLLQELVLVLGIAFLAEAVMTYFEADWAMSRNVLMTGSGLTLIAVFAWRILLAPGVRNRLGLRKVLFVGFPEIAASLADEIGRNPQLGFVPLGYLDQKEPARLSTTVTRLGSPQEIESVALTNRPDCVVVAESDRDAVHQVQEFVALRFTGVEVHDVSGFCEQAVGRVCAGRLEPSELLCSGSFQPNEFLVKLQSMYSTVAALLALPVAVPLIAIIAIVLRARSSGPMFIREQYVGLGGVPFTARRFRNWPLSGTTGPGWSDLERLPLIWNVLCGDMSCFGPAPDRIEFEQRLSELIPFHRLRIFVRPGLIGWAQLASRKHSPPTDAIRRLECDLYYIKNLSPLLDSLILLRWIREVIFRG